MTTVSPYTQPPNATNVQLSSTRSTDPKSTDSSTHTLCLTTSNSSSLNSYTSSLADSSLARTSSTFGSKLKDVLNRKRSKSLVSLEEVQQTHQIQHSSNTNKFSLRNRSISSAIASPITLPKLTHTSSTRDNSVSSLSDFELESTASTTPITPISPLFKIEENHSEKTGKFVGPSDQLGSEKVFDDIADSILKKVDDKSQIDWNI